MGFVDLHCHILWGLDDGCVEPPETLEAARLLVDLGFTEAAPSPHAVPGLPSGDSALAEARRADAAVLFERGGVALTLHPNAENRLDDEFMARVEAGARRGIGAAARWVLVEAPFQGGLPAMADLVFRLRRKGISPLFAHPERCAEFERPGRAEEIVRLGGALQLNVGSLEGVYGKDARKLAERFLGDGLYAVAATDLHHPANSREWLARSLARLEKRAGKDGCERLLSRNPRSILAGEEVA